jgi:pimeloyl-ACP methyl ester carboxylesterase
VKRLSILVAVLAAALLAWAAAARSGALDSDPAEARARYGSPPSQFVEIDGTRLHYRDEGQGPVLVLLHGSRASLQQWDGWVAQLGSRFRIIRVDAFAHGLTGPDGRNDYGAERQLQLLDALLVRLGVERFVLGGTSGGATEAVRYTVLHPERVEKLVLSTVPLRLPVTPRTRPLDRAVFWFHDVVLRSYGTDLYWRTFLRSIFGDPDKVTDEMVTRYRILNTQPGQQARFRTRIATWRASGGPERDFALAARVAVPVLIQWGGAGPVLPQELHCTIASAFTGAPVRVITYPDVGHKLVMEDPVRTAQDALAFIVDGSGGTSCPPASPAVAAPESAAAPATAAARSDASVAASSR